MGTQVVYLTKDLLFSSRVMSLAGQAGVMLKVVRSRQAVAEFVRTDSCKAVFVDLEHPEAQIDRLMDELKQFEYQPKVIAYGPHVKEAMLEAAQQAGAEVLSRGQFDKQVGTMLQNLSLEK